jgi:hypothetical protein
MSLWSVRKASLGVTSSCHRRDLALEHGFAHKAKISHCSATTGEPNRIGFLDWCLHVRAPAQPARERTLGGYRARNTVKHPIKHTGRTQVGQFWNERASGSHNFSLQKRVQRDVPPGTQPGLSRFSCRFAPLLYASRLSQSAQISRRCWQPVHRDAVVNVMAPCVLCSALERASML